MKCRNSRVKLRNVPVKCRNSRVKLRNVLVKCRNSRVKLRNIFVKYRNSRVKCIFYSFCCFTSIFRSLSCSFRYFAIKFLLLLSIFHHKLTLIGRKTKNNSSSKQENLHSNVLMKIFCCYILFIL